MKKTIAVLLSLILLTVSFTAFASYVSIGNTGLALSLTNDFKTESLTQDDISDGMISYWFNDDIELEIYAEADDYTVDDLLDYFQDDSSVTGSGIVRNGFAGLRFGYIEFTEDDSYGDALYGIEYFTNYNGNVIEFCFYARSKRDLSEAESVMQTLTAYGTSSYSASTADTSNLCGSIALGNTGYCFSLPCDYTTEQLTSEDIADDMVGYWCTDNLGVALYVYDSGYNSLDEVVSDAASDSDAVSSGITTLNNGLTFAYCIYQDSDNTEIDYIALRGKDTIQLVFLMYTDEAAAASAEAAQIMESIR